MWMRSVFWWQGKSQPKMSSSASMSLVWTWTEKSCILSPYFVVRMPPVCIVPVLPAVFWLQLGPPFWRLLGMFVSVPGASTTEFVNTNQKNQMCTFCHLIYFLEATHALGWLRPESTCQAMFKHGLSVASRCPLWMHKCGEVAHRILHLRQRFESCLVYSIQVVLFYYKININIIQYKAHIISHVFTCTVAQSIYAIYSIKRGISRCYHGQVAYYILGMAGIPLRYCRWCYCWHGIQSGAKRQDTTWADLACF